ncbi:hypothetical protein BDV41DRAFT_561966 [Aspergillus transmontanensis]|uniref:PD-(D/E)XK nuclease-like domain-containing protein n=1 Tax=Aspergillus transmontanensis TaxID=1034304 RepID=A0A5N6W7S2_9EURO|nr:hypothetical protein BDV41DRAFT_561966 [Aspergillus transmontanensis]
MKKKDIVSWLDRVETEPNPSPPSSDIHEYYRRKRHVMSRNTESSPRKRPRSLQLDDVDSHTTSLTDRTRINTPSRTSSGPGRQRNTRELLNELPLSSPSIHCFRPKHIPLPASVLSLRKKLSHGFGSNIIPIGLKAKLYQEDPQGAVDIPDLGWDCTADWSSAKLEALWEDVVSIYKEAAECEEYGQDENAWATGVILPILQRGIKQHPTLHIKNVQSQTIDPILLPRTQVQSQVNRKLDFTFAFSLQDRRIKEIHDTFLRSLPGQTVSHTTDPFTKRVALFSGVEVKQPDGSSMEALVQLSIWLSAGLEKLSQLRNLQGHEFDLLPTLGWTVMGHEWRLHFAFKGCFEGQEETYLDGPTEILTATTRTFYGIFKLIDLVHRVSAYAEEVYWPWMSSKILTPLDAAPKM